MKFQKLQAPIITVCLMLKLCRFVKNSSDIKTEIQLDYSFIINVNLYIYLKGFLFIYTLLYNPTRNQPTFMFFCILHPKPTKSAINFDFIKKIQTKGDLTAGHPKWFVSLLFSHAFVIFSSILVPHL